MDSATPVDYSAFTTKRHYWPKATRCPPSTIASSIASIEPKQHMYHRIRRRHLHLQQLIGQYRRRDNQHRQEDKKFVYVRSLHTWIATQQVFSASTSPTMTMAQYSSLSPSYLPNCSPSTHRERETHTHRPNHPYPPLPKDSDPPPQLADTYAYLHLLGILCAHTIGRRR